MADLQGTFKPQDVPEDDRNFDPIPAGNYRMQVIESKLEPTSTGSGEMLTLTLEILEGQYVNRRIWDRLNIRNQNPDAQRIAQRALADLCLAVGVSALRDSEELHFKPFTGRVTIQPDKSGQYGPQNRVRYAQPKNQPASGQQRAPAQQGQQQQRQPAQAGGGKPWNNPKPQQQAQKDIDDEIPF